MAMASDWQSFDRQFEPYPARLLWRPRGVAYDAIPESMQEYISPPFFIIIWKFDLLGIYFLDPG